MQNEYEEELDKIFVNDPIIEPVKVLSNTDKRKINVPENKIEESKEIKESQPKKNLKRKQRKLEKANKKCPRAMKY